MQRLIAPENDYSAVSKDFAGEPALRVAVVIPVFNRVGLLVRTLAGLADQSYPRHLWSVVVADDGSSDDVPGAVQQARALFTSPISIEVVRREHDGYGAGQARTLGALRADADVIVFVDADCLPDRNLIANHARWHHQADNFVVVGARHGLDTSELTPGRLAADGLPAEVTARIAQAPSDFRRVFYRRTADLRAGDEAFRSLVSSNFSVARQGFVDVGGFAPTFSRWGGEDTELGWRLFAGGFFFIPDNEAVIFHQTQEDGAEGWREEARTANDAHIQNTIPHRFYRRSKPGHIYLVPKVSWIVTSVADDRAGYVWEEILAQNHTDFEAIFVGEQLVQLAEENEADPRLQITPDLKTALAQARGEYVAILNGWASIDHRLMSRAVRRLDSRPRTSLLTAGYQIPGPSGPLRYRLIGDVDSVDQAWDEEGLPIFAVVRRREWSKALGAPKSIAEAWDIVQEISERQHLADCLVALPAPVPSEGLPVDFAGFVADRSQFVADLREAASPAAALPAVARYVASRVRGEPYRAAQITESPAPAAARPDRPSIRYVGWSGRDNLGDEAMLSAIEDLMGWGEISTSGEPGDLLLLGGGTLINRKSYLRILREKDSPRVERAVLGTGVAHPDYWGITESTSQWVEFLDSCVYAGVRGPRSADLLRTWGYTGDLEVVGDPALALVPPPDAPERDRAHVVVSPAWTRGSLWGGSDEQVFAALAALIRELVAEGRPVTVLSCFPADDRHIIEIMRRAELPDLPYLAGYADTDEALRLLAGAGLVVAERLHAAILAAACGTPFVGLEYRPKLRDFGASMGLEQYIIRTDELGSLTETISDVEHRWDETAQAIEAATARYRQSLRSASEKIREALR